MGPPVVPRGAEAGVNVNGRVVSGSNMNLAANMNVNMNMGMNMGAGVGIGIDGAGLEVLPPQTPNRQPSLPPTTPSQNDANANAASFVRRMSSGGVGVGIGMGPAPTPSKTAAVPATPGPTTPGPTPAAPTRPLLPPLPANVNLNAKVTRVSVVPLAESSALIPPLTPEEIEEIQGWMKVDREYEALYRKMRERMVEEVRETVAKPRAWWERDAVDEGTRMAMVNAARRRPPEKFALTGLRERKDERMRRKPGRREGFRL